MGIVEFHLSRRKLLLESLVAGAGAVDALIAWKSGEIEQAVNFARRLSAPVIHELATRTGREEFKILELLNPFETFQYSPSFKNNLIYSHDSGKIITEVFGDSNIRGPGGDDLDNAPPRMYADEIRDRIDLEVYMNAMKGATTQDVREGQLVRPKDEGRLQSDANIDVWMNVGGNDLKRIAATASEAQEVIRLAHQPFRPGLIELARKMVGGVDKFERDFAQLLDEFSTLYGGITRHFVVLTLPDFGKAHKVTSQKIEDKYYDYPIENGIIEELSHNVSIVLNNRMLNKVNEFMAKHPTITVVGINTFNLVDREDFGDDQHYNEHGVRKIVEEVTRRTDIV